MKKALGIGGIAMMLLLSTTAFATSPTSKETPVTYSGIGNQVYELEVPAGLNPGQTGQVKIHGTWSSNKRIDVTADEQVELINSIDKGKKELQVDFDNIHQVGSNTNMIEITKEISVENINDALFGTWNGNIIFNVTFKQVNELSVPESIINRTGLEDFDIDVYNPTGEDVEIENSDSTVAEVEFENGKLVVNPLKEGNTTIKLKQSASNDYHSTEIEFSINIEKLDNNLSVPKTEYTINGPTTLSINATNLAGAITAKSSNNNIAKVAVTENRLTITPVSAGTVTITLNTDATDLYRSASTSFKVKINRINNTLTTDKDRYQIMGTSALEINIRNLGSGALTVSNSVSTVASATISNEKLTVTPKTEGVTVLTIKSTQTGLYNAAEKQITIDVSHNYVNGICTRCGEKDINTMPAGLYDNNWNLKTSWQTLINNKTLYVNDGVLTSNVVTYADGRAPTNNSSSALNGVLVIPEGINTLNDSFCSCDYLQGVVIPESVTVVNGVAFYSVSSKLYNIMVKPGNTNFKTVNGILYDIDMTRIIKYPANKTATTFTIPSSVNKLDTSAFMSNKYIKTVTIPKDVTVILGNVFDSCSALTSINIPEGVTSIGGWCFSHCANLSNVYLPDTLQSIGAGCFNSCTKLTKLYIPKGVVTTTDSSSTRGYRGIVPYCSSSLKIYCGASSKPSGWGTYWNCQKLTNDSTARYSTYWNYTREQFNALK